MKTSIFKFFEQFREKRPIEITNVTPRKLKVFEQTYWTQDLQLETPEKTLTVPNYKVENFKSFDFLKTKFPEKLKKKSQNTLYLENYEDLSTYI